MVKSNISVIKKYVCTFSEFQILEVGTWIRTPNLLDVGTFDIPLLTCELIKPHIKRVLIPRLYTDTGIRIGYVFKYIIVEEIKGYQKASNLDFIVK